MIRKAWLGRSGGEPVFRAWVDGGRCYPPRASHFSEAASMRFTGPSRWSFSLEQWSSPGRKLGLLATGLASIRLHAESRRPGHYVCCSGQCQDRLRQILQRFAHSLHPGTPEPHPRRFESRRLRRRSSLLPKIKLCRLGRIRRRLLRCLILCGFVSFAPSLAAFNRPRSSRLIRRISVAMDQLFICAPFGTETHKSVALLPSPPPVPERFFSPQL